MTSDEILKELGPSRLLYEVAFLMTPKVPTISQESVLAILLKDDRDLSDGKSVCLPIVLIRSSDVRGNEREDVVASESCRGHNTPARADGHLLGFLKTTIIAGQGARRTVVSVP